MKPDPSDSSKLSALRETLFESPAVALIGLLLLLLLVWFFWLQPARKTTATTGPAPLATANSGAPAYLIASAAPLAASAAPPPMTDSAVASADSGSHTTVILTSKPDFMSDADWARLQNSTASASSSTQTAQQAAQLRELLDLQQKVGSWRTAQPAMREQISEQMLQKMPQWVASGIVSPDQAQQIQQALLNAQAASGNPQAGNGYNNGYNGNNGYGGGSMGGGADGMQSPVPVNNNNGLGQGQP